MEFAFGEPTESNDREGDNAMCDSASAWRPRGVEDPRHAEKLHGREPGDPDAAREKSDAGATHSPLIEPDKRISQPRGYTPLLVRNLRH
jgi:hypothetical protein